MKKNHTELTKAEEEVMQHLWEMDGAFVKDVIARMPDPKPAYNTVSTIARILEQKGFVTHESHGRSHKYIPIIARDKYRSLASKSLLDRFFDKSLSGMVHFFVDREDVSVNDIDEMMQILEETKRKKVSK
ncbi:MAG: BlaI/MecI/CopY family transcriptional regulator [Bacteroidetes bacterium]|nr:MAG: BlaI/MecI/CopY family transcriptional regulator [Bacteroidota bacterium]